MALNFLSDFVFEIPTLFLNVIGTSTILRSFLMPNVVINNANNPLLGFTITLSEFGYVNCSIIFSKVDNS